MAITVEFKVYGEAVLDDGEWTHPNKKVQRMLNGWNQVIDTTGSDPYPALTVAQEIAKQLGGNVTKFDPIKPKANRVY